MIPMRHDIGWNGWGTTTHFFSLSLHQMRGEGWGEGLRASAWVAALLFRPAANFSPPPRKGEGVRRGVRLAFQRLVSGIGMWRETSHVPCAVFRQERAAATRLLTEHATQSKPFRC